MINKVLKGVIFAVMSSFSIYFLGGIIPKIIDLIDVGYEKTFCIAIYWICIFSMLVFPQYWVWFTEEDIDFISPLKSMVAFAISIFGIVGVTLVTDKIFNAITLSTTAGLIYTICFWLFALLIVYVPQIFVYEPIKESLREQGMI